MSGLTSAEQAAELWMKIQKRHEARERERLKHPEIELRDGDFRLRGLVAGERMIEWEFIENETGTATLELSLDHYLAQWVMNHRGRAKRNVIIVIEKQGARWSGLMDHYRVVKTDQGDAYLEIVFLHDFEQAKHIRVWCNPFLRPELQFPKAWIIFGPAKWCLLVTLFVNLLRLETSLWTLPDDPTDLNEWMGPSFNPANWRNIVKPFPFLLDNSPITLVFSRFGTFYDTAKQILEDHQLTLTCRRYIKDRDPHPFNDLKGLWGIDLVEDLLQLIPLRDGCVVWDIEDNSGWGTETAFGGSWLTGFVRAIVHLAGDGQVEGVDVFSGDYTYPGQYYNPLFLGTSPVAPWVVLEEGPLTGIKSSEFSYYEATDTSFLAGGQSAPGINEGISALINIGGDLLTSFINTQIAAIPAVAAAGLAIDLPPLGGLIDAVLQPLYTDVIGAFMEIPTLRAMGISLPISGLEDVLTGLGDFHYYEGMAEGSMKAFTLSAFAAIAAEIHKTRARTAHTLKVSDAAPYIFAPKPYGHCWIGDRVGTSVLGYPVEHQLFVERIRRIKYRIDKDGPKPLEIEIGYREPKNPALHILEEIRRVNGALGTAGIL
ncbi:minor tail protein [Mycobacterium phage Mulciber]|uniref:minor tail protein n=1 Tax=Mycobacterium phage Mulciber TaxID=1805459 RepID=UPI00078DA2DF|nr:minor tail protein [Mycobacterium phage Mulciber]AQT28227.1 minor tail protein [Mycobacterium phage Jabith]ASR86665.1 minor tail protein [Mycobacterium phage Et2Brutus]AXC33487.1 minor tail protein [Mycobacterium phage Joselito]QBI98398.1 minor tail protein [Mycobacterium phage Munch]QBI99057.1 minor tail protein [Mycobacterium phage Salz]QBP32501.1 minor tail protein [Mycobacterium phage Fibonacci]QFG05007.1 minor tail protein [Mycobacterium phage Hutc2]QGZ16443.1 minor tail protein [My